MDVFLVTSHLEQGDASPVNDIVNARRRGRKRIAEDMGRIGLIGGIEPAGADGALNPKRAMPRGGRRPQK